MENLTSAQQQSYPPGEHFSVPRWPNVSDVDRLGGYNIAADRLAIIDGQADPWRGDTPHSPAAPNRDDTTLRPFKLIPSAHISISCTICWQLQWFLTLTR